MNKYNKKSFSKNPGIDKKIKALFLLFDKNVEDFKLTFEQSISLINNWISVFVSTEEYELADAFKKRKLKKWHKFRKIKRVWSVKLFWRVWRFRFSKWFKK